jgi:hypothetical protein
MRDKLLSKPAEVSSDCLLQLTLTISQLLLDGATPLKICTSASSNDSKDSKDQEDSKSPGSACYVPRSLLEDVSPKLVDTCTQGLRLTHVSDKVTRIFVTWLIYQKLDVEDDDEGIVQVQLAQAWNFGAEYEMPAFQDKVMRKLFKILGTERIHPDAVVEAYRPHERGSLLQRAFVQQLASDMEEDVEGIVWTREDFTGCALGADSQFLLDLQFAGTMGDVEDFMSSSAQDDA